MLNQKASDRIYPKQFILLIIILSITFKVTMLPQYLAQYAGRSAYIAMAFMLIVELLLIGIIYGVISRGSLMELNIPRPLKNTLIAAIMLSSFIKSCFLTSGTMTYVGVTLFEKGPSLYVFLALIPVVVYMSVKGINLLGRVCQICFWFIIITFAYMFLFAQVDYVWTNLTPLNFGDAIVACDKHIFWFGDFTPLLLASLTKSGKSSKVATMGGLGFMVAAPILLMIVFTSNFGGGAIYVPNAFGKLAIYNRISIMLGTVDFPTVCTWIIMSILKISITLTGLIRGMEYFFGSKWWLNIAVVIALWAATVFGLRDLYINYSYSTSVIRYVVAAIEFGAPMIAYIALRIFDKDHEQNSSTAERRLAAGERIKKQRKKKLAQELELQGKSPE